MAGKWVYDGTAWQPANAPAAPPANQVNDYITSTTASKPAGARFLFLEMLGGGADGGANSTNQFPGCGGTYVSGLISADAVPTSIPVTVGAPGGASQCLGLDTGVAGTVSSTALGKFAPGAGNGTQGNFAAYSAGQPGFTTGGYAPAGCPTVGKVARNGGDSNFGGGAGATDTGTPGQGGLLADTYGALKAGNGANSTTVATAPGGGGAGVPLGAAYDSFRAGTRGQVRHTWIF